MAFHDHLSQAMALHHYSDQQLTDEMLPEPLGQPSSSAAQVIGKSVPAPTWLNNAILRQQSHHYEGPNFLHLQTTNSDSSASNQWLSRPIHPENDDVPVSTESMIAMNKKNDNNNNNEGEERDWQSVKCKADILSHPLYDQLLSAHVSCLRIATPVDQLPRIDAQLSQSQQVLAKYSVIGQNNGQPLDDKDLDQFMVINSANYLL